jgi:hypothetical protein
VRDESIKVLPDSTSNTFIPGMICRLLRQISTRIVQRAVWFAFAYACDSSEGSLRQTPSFYRQLPLLRQQAQRVESMAAV